MKALGSLEAGSIVKIRENGAPVEYLIVQQGLPSDMYDASCNGTWCLRVDIAEERQWDTSNINSYADSTINAYLNGEWLNRYDENFKNVVKQVKIPYTKGTGENGSVASGANGLPCRAFLLGIFEVGLNDFAKDSDKLSFFEFGNTSSANNKRIALLGTRAGSWYLRSVPEKSEEVVGGVETNGRPFQTDCRFYDGLRPALILPPSLIVEDDGTVTVPTIDFPSGGLGVQLQDEKANPIFPQTRGDLVEGLNGDSVAGNLAELGADMQSVQGDISALALKQEQANTEIAAKLAKSGGAMTGTLADSNAAQVRNITLSVTDLEAGVSPLATGELYFVYE